MLNTGKKIRGLRDKTLNILTLVLSEKKILSETKNHNLPPPFQVKWSVPNENLYIKEQTLQWQNENEQKDKQGSTKNYTEDNRLSNANPTKHRGVPYMFTVPAPLVTSVVL